MAEKWIEGAIHKSTGNPFTDGENLARANGERISVTLAASTANTPTRIKHNLNRVPQGMRIVNVILDAAADVVWYRLLTDDDWNEQHIDVRFRFDAATVLLEVV